MGDGDSELLCDIHDHPRDRLERLGLDALDVLGQRRALGRPIGDPELAKGPVRLGVGKVKRQLVIAEAIHLLDHHGSQNLSSGETARTPRHSARDILRHQCPEHRMLIEKV